MEAHSNLEFTLSAKGGVGVFTWLDHPSGTIGYFVDTATNIPTNGFHLIPGQDRTRKRLFQAVWTRKAHVYLHSEIRDESRFVN
jgi:hypothetical protein